MKYAVTALQSKDLPLQMKFQAFFGGKCRSGVNARLRDAATGNGRLMRNNLSFCRLPNVGGQTDFRVNWRTWLTSEVAG